MTTDSSLGNYAEIFICPMSGQKLKFYDEQSLLKWNDLIHRGEITDLAGNTVSEPLQQAFVTDDENLLYPIRENILMILPTSAYALGCDAKKWQLRSCTKTENVKAFYDSEGWQQQEETYKDAQDSEDLRQISSQYIQNCHHRLKRYLPQQGKFLLDIASGPVQYDAYQQYCDNFDLRICADISIQALKQAQNRMQSKAIYVLCDITKLPFRTNALDACISLHTIYHVPKDDQLRAFAQLHRVLKPSGKAVIVYSWGKHSFLMKCTLGPLKFLYKILRGLRIGSKSANIYFHANNYAWITKVLGKRFQIDLYPWRSINVPFMKIFIHRWLGGKFILNSFYFLEEKYPKLMSRIGAYPVIVINKSNTVYREPHSV